MLSDAHLVIYYYPLTRGLVYPNDHLLQGLRENSVSPVVQVPQNE